MTRVLKACFLTLALATAVAGGARAQNTLYYVDYIVGAEQFQTALDNVGATTTLATDPDNFAALLGGGGFDLAVFFQQNSLGSDFDAAFDALDAFIGGGGAAIAADWTLNAAHADGFDAGIVDAVFPGPMIVTNVDLANGITNPVALYNPGWGTWAVGLTGTAGASYDTGEVAIVIGNGGRTLFNGFLSDTIEDPTSAVTLFENEIRFVTGASPEAPVPEPGILTALAAMGVSGLGIAWRRRRA